EEIVMFFEWNDQPIQDFSAANPLPAEVVDHERAAVRFQLHRRFGNSSRGVETCFEVFEREFAAHDDRGPADEDPTTVILEGVDLRRLNYFVAARIVDPHQFAVDRDNLRNPDALAERRTNALGDAGFTIARRTVQKQPAAIIERLA